jgi:hypothetical protein
MFFVIVLIYRELFLFSVVGDMSAQPFQVSMYRLLFFFQPMLYHLG